ncbi:kdgA [Symbiodinium pilosum]|uniref:KdgA protein n=1 Tax=Symbiodinium pilosum TaxID=2952 RepID=A0A812NEJ1_SYMPI|nr:kdgA [Symbiodinium pilosum]
MQLAESAQVKQITVAKAKGASFALSPIDPLDFVEECHRQGVLAIPSALTSNECWALHRRGTRLIKLFPAGLLSPAILKSMLDITPLGENLNILPSGSVTPENAKKWLEAGAAVIGMGSNLVGKDVSFHPGTEDFNKARADWQATGRSTAEKVFKELVAV